MYLSPDAARTAVSSLTVVTHNLPAEQIGNVFYGRCKEIGGSRLTMRPDGYLDILVVEMAAGEVELLLPQFFFQNLEKKQLLKLLLLK